jgi:hypothetical protein
MQAPEREDAAELCLGPGVRLLLPEALRKWASVVLGPLIDRSTSLWAPDLPALGAVADHPALVRVWTEPLGWRVERDGCSERAASEDELLLRLQDVALESIARYRNWLLFQGSVVTRGSQSLLIVGDRGSAHRLLAVALTALEFRWVSVGLAALDARRLVPCSLPLAFRLGPAEREALGSLPGCSPQALVRVSPDMFRPESVATAPEPTHVLFPEACPDSRALVRPISATTARARLCDALLVAPHDPSPFAAIAGLLRPARGVHLAMGDLPQSLEQLARLLPRWSVE